MKRGLALVVLLAASLVAAVGAVVWSLGPTSNPRVAASPADRLDPARAAYLRHWLSEAEMTLRDVLRDRPDDRDARLLLGRVLVDRGRLLEARATFESVLKEDAKDVDALRGLARALVGLKQAPTAVAQLRTAVGFRGEDPGLWKELGLAQRDAGDAMGAFASLQKSLELDPEQADLSALLPDLLQAPSVPGLPGQPRLAPADPLSPTGGLRGHNRPRPPTVDPLAA